MLATLITAWLALNGWLAWRIWLYVERQSSPANRPLDDVDEDISPRYAALIPEIEARERFNSECG